MIPKIIHQSWKTEDLSTYPRWQVKNWVAGVKRHYSDCEYMFWTDADIEHLIMSEEFNFLKDAWAQSTPIMKSDISRYAMVYKFGGVWMDLDMKSIRRVHNLFDNEWDFVGYRASRANKEWVTGNAFFGAKRGSNLLDKLLWDISQNEKILSGKIKGNRKKGWGPGSYCRQVLDSTGPEAIHRIYKYLFHRKELEERVHHFPLKVVDNWRVVNRPRPRFLAHVQAFSWSGPNRKSK